MPVPKRYVTTRNQLVAGVFLHQTRTHMHVNCRSYFSEKLASLCQVAAAGHLYGGAWFTMLFPSECNVLATALYADHMHNYE